MIVAWSTFPDAAKAEEVARALVEERLAACGSLVPGIISLFHWEGRIERTGEVLVIFKLPEEGYARFEKRLRQLHPYDVPEIAAIEAGAVAKAYAAWVDSVCRHP